MNVFELAAKLTLDTSDYEKDLKKAGDETKDFGSNASDAEGKTSKFGSALKKGLATAAKVAGAALAAAGTAVIALSKSIVQSYADYEQLVGGVETLFGTQGAKSVQEYAKLVGKSVDDVREEYSRLQKSQNTVLANANKAYKTAGMSANAYMETVTSFSASLLQSLDGDTQAAAQAANQAVIDMADNANKMGTSIDTIVGTYQSLARGNFAMLDNLKLGYGGTKEEMERLIADAAELDESIDKNSMSFDNIVRAINVVQTEMGITGTTAKEAASTITGSVNSMKGAWENFKVGIANENADIETLTDELVDSVLTVVGNIGNRAQVLLPRLVDGLTLLAQKLIPEIPPILKELLPAVITGAVGILTGIMDALPELVGIITDMLPTVIDLIFGEAIPAILEAIPTFISTLVDGIVAAVPALLEGIVLLIEALIANLPVIIDAIIVAIPMITEAVNNALMENLPKIIEGIILLVLGIVEKIPDIIQALIAEIPNIVSTLVQVVLENLPLIIWGITELVWGIVKSLPEILQTIWDSLFNWIDGLVQGVKDGWPKFKEAAELWGDKLLEGLKEKWDAVKQWASDMWSSVQEWFKGLKDQFLGIGEDLLNGLWDGLRNIWNQVSTWFTDAWDGLVGKAKSILGIKSPSRVFASIGEMVAKGFEVGFENEFLTVEKNMSNAFDNLAPDPFEITAAGNVTASSGNAYGKSVTVTQNIYAERMTPAQAFHEAIMAQERAVFMGV